MRIQLTYDFWHEIDSLTRSKKEYITVDGLAKVATGTEGCVLDDDYERYFVFMSTRKMDCQDFPLEVRTAQGGDLYFDTEAFEVLTLEQVEALEEKETHKEHKCNCNCGSESKELLFKLASALEEAYFGKIDENCTYLDPSIKSVLNEVVKFKRDEEYKHMNILNKIGVLINQCKEDQKNCRTSYEEASIARMTFRKILEELIEFGILRTANEIAIQPQTAGEESPSYETLVVSALVEKFRYQEQ